MAYILTPRFVPAYQASQCGPFGFCAPVSRPRYSYRVTQPQPLRPQYSSFNQFFSQVDELLNEIDREAQRQAQHEAHLEAQREAHRQRQQRKRALRAQFTVSQNEQGWQVDGDMHGFNQENVTIEITDENTLKIAGNTHWQSEKTASGLEASSTIEQPAEATQENTMDDITLNEPDVEHTTETETATVGPDSDTESHKSYQATVEDDFEDLGGDAASLISASSASSTVTEAQEPKGKEKATEESASVEAAASQGLPSEVPSQSQQEQTQQQERVHGSFERNFRFPERIDAANVSASFREGTLKITVPKAQIQQTRRIAIL